MGYYMEQFGADFVVIKDKIPEMIKAIHVLNKHTHKMSGGTYGNGRETKHYAWVDMNFVNTDNVEEIFKCWRWSVDFNEDGSITDISFNGEKLGDDKILFDAIAPFVENNSFIEMSGEDGERWRWKFKNGKCVEIYAKVTWDDD